MPSALNLGLTVFQPRMLCCGSLDFLICSISCLISFISHQFTSFYCISLILFDICHFSTKKKTTKKRENWKKWQKILTARKCLEKIVFKSFILFCSFFWFFFVLFGSFLFRRNSFSFSFSDVSFFLFSLFKISFFSTYFGQIWKDFFFISHFREEIQISAETKRLSNIWIRERGMKRRRRRRRKRKKKRRKRWER